MLPPVSFRVAAGIGFVSSPPVVAIRFMRCECNSANLQACNWIRAYEGLSDNFIAADSSDCHH